MATTITLLDAVRAHCSTLPRTAEESALLALDGTVHADDGDARLAIEAALGVPCDERRTAYETFVDAPDSPITEATGRAVATLD